MQGAYAVGIRSSVHAVLFGSHSATHGASRYPAIAHATGRQGDRATGRTSIESADTLFCSVRASTSMPCMFLLILKMRAIRVMPACAQRVAWAWACAWPGHVMCMAWACDVHGLGVLCESRAVNVSNPGPATQALQPRRRSDASDRGAAAGRRGGGAAAATGAEGSGSGKLE